MRSESPAEIGYSSMISVWSIGAGHSAPGIPGGVSSNVRDARISFVRLPMNDPTTVGSSQPLRMAWQPPSNTQIAAADRIDKHRGRSHRQVHFVRTKSNHPVVRQTRPAAAPDSL